MSAILYFAFALIAWPILFRVIMYWMASDFYTIDNVDVGFGVLISGAIACVWPAAILGAIFMALYHYIFAPVLFMLMPQKAKEKYRS